ncbi:MAG: hypothetical protein QXV85_07810 [Candidatus Bathyarchaeia archaeon]
MKNETKDEKKGTRTRGLKPARGSTRKVKKRPYLAWGIYDGCCVCF